jgi:superfamily II DNA or RNA helicase
METDLLYILELDRTLTGWMPCLCLRWRAREKNGRRGVLRELRAQEFREPPLWLNETDRRLLALLRGADTDFGGSTAYGLRGGLRVPLSLGEILYPDLARTGRLHVMRQVDRNADPGPAYALEEGPPWTFALELRKTEKPRGYEVSGSLRRGDERMDLSEPPLVIAGGFVFARNLLARLEDRGSFRWIVALRSGGGCHVPVQEVPDFLRALFATPDPPPVDLPPELGFTEASPSPSPVLRVSRPREGSGTALVAGLSFDYGGSEVPAGPRLPVGCDVERRVILRRDLVVEDAAAAKLREVGFKSERWTSVRTGGYTILHRKFPSAVAVLVAGGFRVEAEGKLYRSGGSFKIDVASGIDWFELEGAMEFDGAAAKLPALLAAVKKGERMVLLDDGSFGLLPEEWLARWGFLAGVHALTGETLRFRPTQTALLDALLAARPEISFDGKYEQARRESRRFEAVEPEDPPPTFRGELRPYQRVGLGWFRFLERFGFGGCLADDMGLGKTVQALALLDRRRAPDGEPARPSLVVAPRSVLFNWAEEAARFAPRLRLLTHHGAGRTRAPEGLAGHDLVLTTYATLLKDIRFLKDMRFDTVILDEAQAVKNASTATSKAVRLLDAGSRLALSGTPVENHVGELWSLLEFLNPGMLGSAPVFERFFRKKNGRLDEASLDLLARAVRPFVLRRTKAQVAPELPPRTEQTITCDLEGEQRRRYDELREFYRARLLGRPEAKALRGVEMQVLEALLRLRQAACHPGLIDPARTRESSAKLDALLPLIEQVVETGHKALVFSQFTSFLAILRPLIEARKLDYAYLDGQTKDRAAVVSRFQTDPDCRLFLVSLKAGGLGLNLTAAEYVYLLDPWWNPAVEAQAIDRTHRIGQSRQVFAYRIIARDTVEERVLELQRRKRDLADSIIRADGAPLGGLTREDLQLLLG